ncbi:MAG TPA: hypothetical protein VJ792_04795 [Candidatus Nitrosotalea sp.]|nr:hypothetical protein [Candidatus Nitrosotalea sp.]
MKIVRSTTKSLDLGKLCKTILSSNLNIQVVEIVSKSGFTLEKAEVVKAPKARQAWKSLGQCLFEISLGDEFDDLYGPIQYNFSDGNLASLTFPFRENLVVVTTTKNISPISMATKIAQIIFRLG